MYCLSSKQLQYMNFLVKGNRFFLELIIENWVGKDYRRLDSHGKSRGHTIEEWEIGVPKKIHNFHPFNFSL